MEKKQVIEQEKLLTTKAVVIINGKANINLEAESDYKKTKNIYLMPINEDMNYKNRSFLCFLPFLAYKNLMNSIFQKYDIIIRYDLFSVTFYLNIDWILHFNLIRIYLLTSYIILVLFTLFFI
jgi:hypothetical protein